MTKLQINTSTYNERRYGRPWIATVEFQSASKTDFKFGEWAGETGYEGLLEIDVQPGQIVARGQKDTRKPSNSAPSFYIYTPGFVDSAYKDRKDLKYVPKKDAYLHYQKSKVVTREDLLIRKSKLETELLTITELLAN